MRRAIHSASASAITVPASATRRTSSSEVQWRIDSVPSLMRGRFPTAYHQVNHAEPRAFRPLQFSVQGDILGLLQSHSDESQRIKSVALELGDLLLAPAFGI